MKILIILIALSIQSIALIFPIVSFSDETGTTRVILATIKVVSAFRINSKKDKWLLNASNISIGSEVFNFLDPMKQLLRHWNYKNKNR